jgi:hypothetical protein
MPLILHCNLRTVEPDDYFQAPDLPHCKILQIGVEKRATAEITPLAVTPQGAA